MAACLSTENILQLMKNALPTRTKDDDTSELYNPCDAIALFCHASMIANGFRLIGLSEENTLDDCTQLAPHLPPEWKSTSNSHTFLYAHEQSSMRYVIKVDRLGSKVEIRGIGLGDERINRFEVVANDYISPSALPLSITMSPDGEEDRSSLEEKLMNLFISAPRIRDLASLFDLAITKKLVPSLAKDHQESNSSTIARDENVQNRPSRNPQLNPLSEPQGHIPTHPYFNPNPSIPVPPRPFPSDEFPPPGFDDEYDLLRSPSRRPLHPRDSPFNIGYDDLNPPGLAPHDPLRGNFIGGGLNRPTSGMYPTFNEPLLGGRGEQNRSPRRPGVPDGARFDPVGPGDGFFGNGRTSNYFGGFRDGDII